MKPVVFLRIASVLTLIHSILHTMGGVFGKPVPGIAATTWAAMRANEFTVFGLTRSYFVFYRGLGLGITICLTAEAIVFWQLGSLAKTDAARLRPLIATFMIAYLVFAVNSYAFFFFGPVVAEILIAACLGMAIATARAAEPVPTGRLAAGRA
jgi:D-alanyl-lipoteichoic acid acyltransferase DltB (MBOAT superfamily)